MQARFSRFIVALCAGALAISLSSCAVVPAEQSRETSSVAFDASDWPRTFTDSTQTKVRIPAQPERVVSTSVSLTGPLLALGVPVIASATAPVGSTTDKDGFLKQWADVAAERKVDSLYEIGKFEVKKIKDQKPDLIVVAASGADSAIDQIDQLQEIAPTIVLDYVADSWDVLSTELGKATGTEENATQNNTEIAERTAGLKETLAIPEGTTASVLSYAPQGLSAVAKTSGPHAKLFSTLGFTVIGPPEELDTSTQFRADFAFVQHDKLPLALPSDLVFLLSGAESTVETFAGDDSLSQLASVQSGSIFQLEPPVILDYYSMQRILDYFEQDFPGLDSSELE